VVSESYWVGFCDPAVGDELVSKLLVKTALGRREGALLDLVGKMYSKIHSS